MSGNASPALPEPTIEQLVTSAVRLNREINTKTVDLEKLKTAIVAKGVGKHKGLDGEAVTVVAESPAKEGVVTYELPLNKPALEKARELSGDSFPKLFDRIVFYVPCKGFADVVPKLISGAKKIGDLLQLTGSKGKGSSFRKAYVKFD